jgi:hypothetical protein
MLTVIVITILIEVRIDKLEKELLKKEIEEKLRNSPCGYTIIDYGRAVNCNGDTIQVKMINEYAGNK